MNSQQEGWNVSVENRVAAIVAEGSDLRSRISKVVTDGADKMPASQRGLIDLSRSVLDGAVGAIDKAVPRDRDNVLRQVIDGLGDGLSTAALAARLAMEEAKSEEQRFADEDLSRITTDLRTVGDLFVDTVSQAASKFKSKSGSELSTLRQHAEQAMKRALPSINAALISIEEHPLQFGKESVRAGVNLTRQALGSLFTALGRQLDKASKQLLREGSVE